MRTPKLRPGALADSHPHRAEAPEQGALGFPQAQVDDWQPRAIARMGELVKNSRTLQVAMDACMNCGACTDKCHYFLGSGDPLNMPVARQELFRSVWRRHFTFTGRHLPWLVGARELDQDMLDTWYSYFHQCSQCRRCAVFCPVGIDTAEISMAARDVMASIGVGQRYSHQVIAKVHQVGNNLGLPEPALRDTLQGLEEDLLDDCGVEVRLPLDEAGADVLLVTPSADFFAEPHVDGLLGYAKVFHQAGLRWTLSTHAAEAANFGLFTGSQEHTTRMAVRIREAAQELGVKRIVFGECGHAWRVAYNMLNDLAGPFDFLDARYRVPQHIVEVTHDLLQRGALRFDPSANDHRRVTFHDSCNIARASSMGGIKGGQFRLPREVLAAACNHVFEMRADTTGEQTFCCGGGGGLLTDELLDIRQKGANPRMSALQELVERDGVTHLVAICAICKSQFAKVLPHYGMEFDQVLSLHQLVGDALVMR
ncbi:MAG: Fe-S oxidoreductase [Gammaproteobacteria bacterium]|jgi:Fe-S oxidoreductase